MSVSFTGHELHESECARWREAMRVALMEPVDQDEPSGLVQHLGQCPACRQYRAELNSTIAHLRSMPETSLQPRAEFRRRWRAAVIESGKGAVQRPETGIVEFLRTLLRDNWRPALGLAMVWIMIAAFKVDSPQEGTLEIGKTGWTPVDVAQFFTTERQLMARNF